MNQNRKRPSRFNDNNNFDNRGPIQKNPRQDYGFNPPPAASNYSGGSNAFSRQMPSNKTPEQLAFDQEFSKWEQSFEQWKKTFSNHPDMNSYREYERKFLDVRDKLLQKRAQIYSQSMNPMDALLNAADSFANSILNRFDSTPKPLMSIPMGNASRWSGGSDNFNRDRGGRDNFDRRPAGRDNNNSFERRDSGNRGRGSGNGRDRRDDRSKGMGSRGGGARNDRGRNNRSDSRGKPSFGGNRDRAPKPMHKPSPREVERDLARKDVYPFNKWYYCSSIERPALVGKRAKKKNAKILRIIERKRRIAAGEEVPEEVNPNPHIKQPRHDLPFHVRIDKMFNEAREAECPKMLPGSGKRRLKNIRSKPESEWTEDEKKFVALAIFITEKRTQYLIKKKEAEAAEQPTDAYDPSMPSEDAPEVSGN